PLRSYASSVSNPGSQAGGEVIPISETVGATDIDVVFTSMTPIQIDFDPLGSTFDSLSISNITNDTGVPWGGIQFVLTGGAGVTEPISVLATTGHVSGVTFNGGPFPTGFDTDIALMFDPAYPETVGLYNGDALIGTGVSNYSFIITPSAVSNVPVPAAIWLFASGLLGLMGISKARKSG
ncbi:MAG TPA: hypothetical protein VET88_09060, partial [Gammaproteobacteria bacterium]|nr:hypothetical protein [Gammaproteobacteria bacterium]